MQSNLDKKMSSLQSFMEVAKYLDDYPNHPIPVRPNVSKSEIEELGHEHRKSRKFVAHILNSIVLEIAIKVIWELDNNAECRHIHDIACLFSELSKKSQEELTEIYDEKVASLASIEGRDQQGKQVLIGDLVLFQTLQEALVANEDTMKNFKYDLIFKGNSSAMGSVIWDDKVFWTFPAQTHQRLPEALYQYANNRVQKANRDNSPR